MAYFCLRVMKNMHATAFFRTIYNLPLHMPNTACFAMDFFGASAKVFYAQDTPAQGATQGAAPQPF